MKNLREALKNYRGEEWIMVISENIIGLPKSTNDIELQRCYGNAPVKDVILHLNNNGGIEAIEVGYEACYSNNKGPCYGESSYATESFTSLEEMRENNYSIKKITQILEEVA